jgi:uncharacterized protein YjbI with pentapeptide repeats
MECNGTRESNAEWPASTEVINESIRSVKQLFILIPGIFVFAGITAITLSPKDILLHSAIKLPVIDLSTPLELYFVLAPILLILAYSYFLFNLKSMAAVLEFAKGNAEKRSGTIRWIVSDYYLDFNGTINPKGIWIEISLFHLPYLAIICLFISSLRIQSFSLSIVGLLFSLAAIVISAMFRHRHCWSDNRMANIMSKLIYFITMTSTLYLGYFSLIQLRSDKFNPENEIVLLPSKFYSIDYTNQHMSRNQEEGPIIAKGIPLKKSNFSSSKLYSPDFSCSDLSHANFENATVVNGIFDEAILYRTNFYRAKCINCSFRKSKVIDTNLQFATLEGSSFAEAQLNNADFRNSILRLTTWDFTESLCKVKSFKDASDRPIMLTGFLKKYCPTKLNQ